MFICGSGSFPPQDNDDYETSSCTTPKKSKRTTSFCKIIGRDTGNKNPYADRGLDKFNALLADLDDKKQQIYTQIGADHVSFVRFVYTNSKRVKPIVVRVKESSKEGNKQDMNHSPKGNIVTSPGKALPNVTGDVTSRVSSNDEVQRKEELAPDKNIGSFKLNDLRQQRYCIPLIMILVLSFLAIFGRSLAITCMSILWYLSPSIIGSSSTPATVSSSKRKQKTLKKVYTKNTSGKGMGGSEGPSSPTSVLTNALTDNKNQRMCQHIRRKSL